jgi:hypothetical protein
LPSEAIARTPGTSRQTPSTSSPRSLATVGPTLPVPQPVAIAIGWSVTSRTVLGPAASMVTRRRPTTPSNVTIATSKSSLLGAASRASMPPTTGSSVVVSKVVPSLQPEPRSSTTRQHARGLRADARKRGSGVRSE